MGTAAFIFYICASILGGGKKKKRKREGGEKRIKRGGGPATGPIGNARIGRLGCALVAGQKKEREKRKGKGKGGGRADRWQKAVVFLASEHHLL